MLYISSDHAGFALKEALKKYLTTLGYQTQDLGAKKIIATDDYPDYAYALAKKVAKEKNSRGILICASGQGVCMAANRVKNIRAALAWNEASAKASRNDDDANILCLGALMVSESLAKKITKTWLETKFAALPKFKRRIGKIG